MEEQGEPKISLVVGVFGLVICIIMDVLSFLPGVADIEEAPALLVLVVSTIFGLGGPIIGIQIVVDSLKAFPVIQALPLWTPAWLVIWWIGSSDSQIAKMAQTAIDTAAVLEGDVEGAEGAGAAAANEAEEAGKLASEAQSAETAGNLERAEGSPNKRPSQEKSAKSNNSNTSGGGSDSDDDDEDQQPQNNDDILIGSEISPDKEADDQDFDLPEDEELRS